MLTSSSNTYADKTDEELVAFSRSADSEAFKEICRRYENIFYKVCQKYSQALYSCGVNVKDIFDEKTYIIYHCVRTFKPCKKAKLATWIGNYARYLCLNSINSRRFIIPHTEDETLSRLEDARATQVYFSKPPATDDYRYALDLLGQFKDKRVFQIFRHRYLGDKKMIWDNVAKKMGISIQTAINLHNRGLSVLREKARSKVISDIV